MVRYMEYSPTRWPYSPRIRLHLELEFRFSELGGRRDAGPDIVAESPWPTYSYSNSFPACFHFRPQQLPDVQPPSDQNLLVCNSTQCTVQIIN